MKQDEQGGPRILVVGAGGIGGVLAGTLLARGHRVEVLCRGADSANALEAHGFRLRGVDVPGDVRAPEAVVRGLEQASGTYDYVLLATQPPDVEAAARSTAHLLAPGGRMVCLQNGLCELRVADVVGEERTLGAVVSWGASALEPGVFERTSSGGFSLGTLRGPLEPEVERLAAILADVGPVKTTENLLGARWSKLAINCAISSLGTLGRDRLGALLRHRFVRRLALEVMSEVVAVAQAQDVELEVVSGTLNLEWLALTPKERRVRGSASLLAKHTVLLAVGARYRRLRSSMLHAIERGRSRRSTSSTARSWPAPGRPTPVNAELQEAVHRMARGELEGGLDDLRALFVRTREQVRELATAGA
ncbi:MAG: 2-dehydropantoate 2-reductase N-terminal domain-containing protein [Planctomycetota bacterium]